MNARKRKAENEALPSTPDTENSWLKIRTNSRRDRISPDPPPSPSPRPRANKNLQEISLGPTQQAGIVQVKDNFAVAGIVHASDFTLAGHVDSNDTIQPTDPGIDAERNDPKICLGDVKQRDGPISSTNDEASAIYPLSGLLPLHSLPVPQIQQILNDSVKHPSDMSKRTRENSTGLIWPQTAQDAFEKAQSAYEANPGTQHTCNNQMLFNTSTQPEVKMEVPRGPSVQAANRMQRSEGSVLQAPFDILKNNAHNTQRTLQSQTTSVNPNTVRPPPRMQNNPPRQMPNNVPRQPNPPGKAIHNAMPPPQPTFTIPPPPPTSNGFTGLHPLSLHHPFLPDHPLSTNPFLTQPLRPGDRVHLLDSSHNDPGDIIWTITSIFPLGVVTIDPLATSLACPAADSNRLLRVPLAVGDIVSVYHQEIQTDVQGNQVFCSAKRGFGRVVRCYVVEGIRRYDVLREDEVGRGVVERGLGDGDVG